MSKQNKIGIYGRMLHLVFFPLSIPTYMKIAMKDKDNQGFWKELKWWFQMSTIGYIPDLKKNKRGDLK